MILVPVTSEMVINNGSSDRIVMMKFAMVVIEAHSIMLFLQ